MGHPDDPLTLFAQARRARLEQTDAISEHDTLAMLQEVRRRCSFSRKAAAQAKRPADCGFSRNGGALSETVPLLLLVLSERLPPSA